MKIINTVTKEIKDITLSKVKVVVYSQANKYSAISNTSINAQLTDTTNQSILDLIIADFLIEDWILLSNYKDWIDDNKVFRCSGNNSQLSQIVIEHPEILVLLNEPPKNPRYILGEFWEVYFNTFTEGSREYLESIGCLIENKPI